MADVTKITLPNGTTKNIKDATARSNIAFVANQGRKNVLKFNSVGGGAYSGIIYTVNNDGTVRATGTANATSYLYLMINDSAVDAKEYTNGQFILSGCPSGGGSNTYSLYAAKGSYAKFDYGDGVTLTPTSETQVFIVLRVEKNQTVDIVFKPMIRLVGTDSTFEPYSLPNTKITPELIDLVDSGAKNLWATPNGTVSGWRETFTGVLPKGDYVISFTNLTSTDTDANTCQIIGAKNGSVASNYAQCPRGNNVYTTLSLTSDIDSIWIYSSNSSGSGDGDRATFTGCMICTKAAWDVSQKYVPYGMSNAELTNNISTFVNPTAGDITFNSQLAQVPIVQAKYITQSGKTVNIQLYIDLGTAPTADAETVIGTLTGIDAPKNLYRGFCMVGAQYYSSDFETCFVGVGTTKNLYIKPKTGTTNTKYMINITYQTN